MDHFHTRYTYMHSHFNSILSEDSDASAKYTSASASKKVMLATVGLSHTRDRGRSCGHFLSPDSASASHCTNARAPPSPWESVHQRKGRGPFCAHIGRSPELNNTGRPEDKTRLWERGPPARDRGSRINSSQGGPQRESRGAGHTRYGVSHDNSPRMDVV